MGGDAEVQRFNEGMDAAIEEQKQGIRDALGRKAE